MSVWYGQRREEKSRANWFIDRAINYSSQLLHRRQIYMYAIEEGEEDEERSV